MNMLHLGRLTPAGKLALALAVFCTAITMASARAETPQTGLAGYRLVRVDGAIGVAILSTPQGKLVAIRPGESIGASPWRLKRLMDNRIEIVSFQAKPAGSSMSEDRAWMAVGEAGDRVRSGIKPPEISVTDAQFVPVQQKPPAAERIKAPAALTAR